MEPHNLKLDKFTIAMPYYESPEMLRTHLRYWAEYPDDIKERVQVVIVDDGSTLYPAIDVLRGQKYDIHIKLYRINENIPWNHGGARNLSMKDGPMNEWVLTCDIDLVFPKESAKALMEMELYPNTVYKPKRFTQDMNGNWFEAARHPECYVMTRKMFWKIGGFDEDFTGYWNGTFTPWRRKMKRVAKVSKFENIHFLDFCFIVKDAMVSDWGRRGSIYDVHSDPKILSKRRIAGRNYKPINHFRYSWAQVI